MEQRWQIFRGTSVRVEFIGFRQLSTNGQVK